ncbi:MAG: RNA polymerase sigma factor [Stagnimonas sp.]|nr:RNA polymerase sigma factor [Stagnimonas sp.]
MAEGASPQGLNSFLLQAQARALRVAEISTRSRDDALDIVQDAMLHLARAYGRRPADEWPPLFHRILENKIRDWQRRQTVRNRFFFWRQEREEDDDAPPPEERAPDLAIPDATERLMQDEAMLRLKSALAELPARQREAFVLRIWEGLSTDDTATAMGCSDGSVKTHLARALANLRGKLGESWSL